MFDVTEESDGSFHFTLKEDVDGSSSATTQALSVEFSAGPFDCTAEGTPVSISFAKAEFTCRRTSP